jgi:hypothetical protein
MKLHNKHIHINEKQGWRDWVIQQLRQGRGWVVTARIDVNITEIEVGTFQECVNLKSVSIPDSVTKIGDGAFKGCSSLGSIIIPESIETIGSFAFERCISLKSIIIPDSVKKIDEITFKDCSSLETVVIPKSVETIGCCAFEKCISLKSIIIPNSVKEIGYRTFQGCSSLQSIAIPDSIEIIENRIFGGCISLKSIIIPDSVEKIGIRAFQDCSSLQSVVIPKSVERINYYAFVACTSLKSVIIPNSVKKICWKTFAFCSSLQSIVIPESVQSIGSHAFEACTSLRSIIVPDSVEDVHFSAFFNCTLLDQRLPAGLNCHHDTAKWLQHRFHKLPIHQACYNRDVTQATLSTLIPIHKATLSFTDAMGMTALHVLSCNPNVTLGMIEMLKAATPSPADVINIKDVTGMTPQMLFQECHDIGEAHDIQDLLRLGLKGNVIECFLSLANTEKKKVFVQTLEKENEVGLVPFMEAAILPQCGLDSVYTLAMMRPNLCIQNDIFQH